jgi:TIR domain/Pentapeptide repeats (8 copies)
MGNPEHLQILKQGVKAWNAWRDQDRGIRGVTLSEVDLRDADLTGADLTRANLTRADLTRATLTKANLTEADLTNATLIRAALTNANLAEAKLPIANFVAANLAGARLSSVNFTAGRLDGACLDGATLHGATLQGVRLNNAVLRGTNLVTANLNRADFTEADLSRAILGDTIFGNTNLTAARGLETCHHRGPSTLDHRTLAQSWPLPLAFLRGCGLPDKLIDYLPSLLNEPVQFYSYFISYASKDDAFAKRLHADLQNHGVRCWFAPEDMKIGDRLRPRIDETIRVYDKLLLVLSKTSVASQ